MEAVNKCMTTFADTLFVVIKLETSSRTTGQGTSLENHII